MQDKNGRDIEVGDYVKKVNRITRSAEDDGYVSKIDDGFVYLKSIYENGEDKHYYSDDLVVEWKGKKK